MKNDLKIPTPVMALQVILSALAGAATKCTYKILVVFNLLLLHYLRCSLSHRWNDLLKIKKIERT
ncbi:hypothetical protein QK911_10520 [Lactococcus lactis]